MTDDMGIGDVSAYLGKSLGPTGSPISKAVRTPSLERLAAQGTLFTDVHSASSVCSPSRYAILTGRYPWRTYNKHKVIGDWATPPLIGPGRPTLATLLQKNGYQTAAFGKWHLGFNWIGADGQPIAISGASEPNWNNVRVGATAGGGYVTSVADGPLAHGFDYFFGLGGNFYLDKRYSLKAYIENNSFVGVPTWDGAPGADSAGPGVTDWDQQLMGEHYINKVLDYIDQHVSGSNTSPFFFYYVPNASHAPYDPAEQIDVQGQVFPIRGQARFSDGSDAEIRDDMVYENDIAVGLLLDKLAALDDPRTGRPLSESTLFIFTSDNGAERHPNISSAGLRGAKGSLFEGGHRVPFIVSWPDGGVPSGAVNSATFGQIDLYASFANLLDHTMGPDEAEDSANVLPALLGQVPGSQFQRPHSMVSHDNRQSSDGLPDDSLLAIRDRSHLMMIDGNLVNHAEVSGADRGRAVPIRLFDLNADLHQDSDLLPAPGNQPRVITLAERLLRFHNQGYSRALGLGAGQILHTDGGVDLRNDRSGAIGFEFTVADQPVAIRSLGMWDDGTGDTTDQETSARSDGQTTGNPDGLSAAHVVRLFDAATQEVIGSVVVNNGNSYLEGEFRYVDLAQPIMLEARRSYALTVDTAPGDGDLFHHFAARTAVGPSSSSLVGDFVARIAATDGEYPSQYPDGRDGADYRHPDMFRHRVFVGPNARIAIDAESIDPNGAPIYNPGADRAVFMWREPDLTWRLRATGGGVWTEYMGTMTADKDFSAVSRYSLEINDILDNSDQNIVLFDIGVGDSWEDGIDFAFPTDANVCFDLSAPGDGVILIGAARIPVTGPFNLTDFGPCIDPTGTDPDGAPAYDPGVDRAIFLWRETDLSWHMRATGGDVWKNYVGTITSDQSFSTATPVLLESRDTLDNSDPRVIVFDLGLGFGQEDGIGFGFPSGANVCFDLSAPTDGLILIGGARTPVTGPFNLTDFGPCN